MLVFCIEKLRCVFQYNFYCEDFIPSSLFFLDLLPETFLAVFIFYTLITMFDDKHSVFQFYRWLFNFLIIFLCLLVKICYFTPVINKLLFGFTWVNCFYTVFSKIFIVVLTILVLLVCLNKFQMGLTLSYLMEFPVIVGFSVLFLLLLTSSYDFFGVYLAIEGLSLTLYTLAGMLHFGVVSVEASIKYYSLGAISTGLFLFGVSLLFGLVGALDFLEVQLFLGGSIAMFAVMEIQLAILCILFGFFFKLSAFPCHI